MERRDKGRKKTQQDRGAGKAPPRPRRSKLDSAGDKILLGWSKEDEGIAIGFGSQPKQRRKAGEPVWLDGEGHLITIAPTGAGKGRGGLLPNLISYQGSAIVIDPKGEAYRITRRAREEMGQKVHVIDPFGLVTEETDSLNPLDAFDIPGVDMSGVAMDIAKQLSGGSRSLKDPFWDVRGHDLSAGLICAAASLHKDDKEKRTLAEVRRMLKADDVTYNLALLLDSSGGKLHRYAYEEIASFVQTTDVTRSGIHATACSYYSVIASDAAQRTIMSSTIDLNAVRRGDPMTIYLVVPPSKLASHAALFRLWTAVLMTAVLSRDGDLPEHRTLFAIDECAQLGDFETLAMVYTLARSYGMRVWAFFQDLAQVQRMLPHEWRTVLTNTAVIQTFGVANHLMATELSHILGDFTSDELRTMDRGNVALQISGRPGLMARRPDYLLDAAYRGKFDPHPMYANRTPKPASPAPRPRRRPRPN